MNWLFTILLMIFCHVVADYNLQGWLASAKQQSYWEANAPDKKYKYDYLCALVTHSFAWTFMVMLPLAYLLEFDINAWFVCMFAWNLIAHALVDHMKANWKIINLWVDQLIHFGQIALTTLLFFVA